MVLQRRLCSRARRRRWRQRDAGTITATGASVTTRQRILGEDRGRLAATDGPRTEDMRPMAVRRATPPHHLAPWAEIVPNAPYAMTSSTCSTGQTTTVGAMKSWKGF